MEESVERVEERHSGSHISEGRDEQILTFEVGQDLWGLPLDSVREVVELVPLTPVPRAPKCVAGVLMLHGRAVTVIPLAHLVDQPKLDHTADERILVIESNQFDIGLLVDRTRTIVLVSTDRESVAARRGVSEVSHEDYESIPFIRSILPVDGEIIALVDPERLLSRIEEEFLPATSGAAGGEPSPGRLP